jgi:opacity protein-like surface antigen
MSMKVYCAAGLAAFAILLASPASAQLVDPLDVFADSFRTGVALSILMGKPEGHQEADEFTLGGVLNNKFLDSHDPLEVGAAVSYNFRPWNNRIVVAPFAELDWTDLSVKHMFAGGQFLGTRSNWIMTFGAKAGMIVAPSVLVYGLAGGGWLNQDLNVNFATSASRNVNTPGFTLGGGIEYAPSTWRLFGKPASAFFQYQHHWWNDARFNMPASSPGFNYVFKREDDVFKVGLNIYFGDPAGRAPVIAK